MPPKQWTEAEILTRLTVSMSPLNVPAMQAYLEQAEMAGLNPAKLYHLVIQGEANMPRAYEDFMAANMDPAPASSRPPTTPT